MDSDLTYLRPASAVVTLPDPDDLSSSSHVEIGGLLEFRCETPNYPTFQVIFDGANPADQEEGHIFEGSIDQPLVIHVHREGDFIYTVWQFPLDGGPPKRWSNKSRARPCPGCKPGG